MSNNIESLNEQIADLKNRNQQLPKQPEKSKNLQKQNEELFRFETLLVELSSRFINLSPNDAETQIVYALKLLADFLDVDQIAVFEILNEKRAVKTIYSYSRDDIRSTLPEMPGELFPCWTVQMRKGNLVVWRKLREIPDEAEQEKF